MQYYVVANWKENLEDDVVLDWLVEFRNRYEVHSQVKVGIAPSLTEISLVKDYLENWNMVNSIDLVGQNVSQFPKGRYTGEVGAFQLNAYQVNCCIVGHSERRSNFAETDEIVAEKVKRLREYSIRPIVAISKISQLESLANLKVLSDDMIIAYEPIESIGTGNPADPVQVQKVLAQVKEICPSVRTLYGGSVDATTVEQFLGLESVEGFLVGTASERVEKFVALLDVIRKNAV